MRAWILVGIIALCVVLLIAIAYIVISSTSTPTTLPTPTTVTQQSPLPRSTAAPNVSSTPGGTPASVLQKYESYKNPLSLTLYRCSHESKTIYQIVFHSGFTSETYQYDDAGTSIGQGYWSDDGSGTRRNQIPIKESDCQIISEKTTPRGVPKP